jgi:hypothetical protein
MIDKERLENMSPIGFDLNGDVLLKSEDYHWLMEQAERVEELETQLSINTNNMKHLQNKIERYKQALEFYADEENYKPFDGIFLSSYQNKVDEDGGEIARQALESDEN